MSLDHLFSGISDATANPRTLLDGVLGAPGTQGALGGAASGVLVSLLMNKKARKKLQKNAVKIGGVAALAGVGYVAYQKWQQAQGPGGTAVGASETPPPLDFDAAAVEVRVSAELPMKLVLAMIAAAAADGTIDSAEMDVLVTAIEDAPIEPDEKARLTSALNDPPTVEAVAALASGEEEASELYGAALTAIEVDTPAENLFLRRFARALHLDPELVSTLNRTLDEA